MFDLDAVISDDHLPEMSGHRVAIAIRHCQPRTLIVMFSGSDVPEETRRVVDAVVLKTKAVEQLLPTVADLCDRSCPS